MRLLIYLLSALVALEGLALIAAPRRVVELLKDVTPNELRGLGLIEIAIAAALVYAALVS